MKKLLAIISALVTGGLVIAINSLPSVLARLCDSCNPALSSN